MTDRIPTRREQMNAVGEVFEAFRQALVPVAEAIQKTWREWVESESGQYMLAVVKYYDEHPEELAAMRAAREAEARIQECHCLCQRWDHLGICAGEAATETTMYLDGESLQVPMCSSCAAAIDRYRLALR